MASDEEKNSIISLTGKYNSVEWPWNKLSISTERKNSREFISLLGDESDSFIVRMMIFYELIMNELIEVHDSVSYYDNQDGGRLSAVLLVTDNFIKNQKKETALTFHNFNYRPRRKYICFW